MTSELTPWLALLSSLGGAVGAWVAVRVELAVLRARLEALEKARAEDVRRLDSVFRVRTGDTR